jgi:hypothetical protein
MHKNNSASPRHCHLLLLLLLLLHARGMVCSSGGLRGRAPGLKYILN